MDNNCIIICKGIPVKIVGLLCNNGYTKIWKPKTLNDYENIIQETYDPISTCKKILCKLNSL